jgi:predicted nucleotidyltransferase
MNTRSIISERYRRITKAVNRAFWGIVSETAHSFYVGSYGRGTAIGTSDLDVLVELPSDDYDSFTSLSGNRPSRLLQTVKSAIQSTYPNTNIKGDGQVVVVRFSDGMKFEILPAFSTWNPWQNQYLYKYPDTHMGGNWLTTNPNAEQKAMKEKNQYSETNGLLFDTCKHIRYVRDSEYSSYHLSGILIDIFCYDAIGGWHFTRENETHSPSEISYEQALLNYYNDKTDYWGECSSIMQAPGSKQTIDTTDWKTLGKILRAMV